MAPRFPNGRNGGGRDERGRFKRGNKAAVGHAAPLAAKVSAIREAGIGEITPDRWARIMSAQADKAEKGDTAAAAFVGRWTQGEPQALDVLERLEKLESMVAVDGYS
jgi:hypothetical protein